MPANQALLQYPYATALDHNGILYIAHSRRIRKCSEPLPYAYHSRLDQVVYTDDNGLGYLTNAYGQHASTIDLNTAVTLKSFGYDDQRRLISIADQFGQQILIQRDTNGVPTAIISPDGLTTGLAVDTDNNLSRITFADGGHYDFEYVQDGLMAVEVDPAGNRFEHLFNETGQVTDVIDQQGGHWQYGQPYLDGNDTVLNVTSGEGNMRTYRSREDATSDSWSSITAPDGSVSTVSRYRNYERFVSIERYVGTTEKQILPCGSELELDYGFDSEYRFKYVKELAERMPSGLARITQSENLYEDSNYDGVPDIFTRRVTVNGTSVTFSSHDFTSSSKTLTSPEGRMVVEYYDPATLLTERVSVPDLLDKLYSYDDRGNLISLQQGTRHASFVYNTLGFIESMTDALNRTTTYEHDPVGRVTRINRPDGSSVSFIYDLNGNMTVLTNPVDVEHEFTFNRANLPSGYHTPISGSYSHVYDKDRNLIQTHFPSGRQINNTYTAGRLTQIQTPQGNIDLTYGCGGKIASMTKGGESIEYGYDGRLLTDVTLAGAINQNLGYIYNDDFDVTSFAYAGDTATYSYDLDGLLTGSSGFKIARNAQNGVPEAVSGKGLNVNRSYNGYGELEAQTVAVSAQPVMQWSLTRNDTGRIITKTETAGGQTYNYEYTYDELGRLLTVNRDGNLIEDYSYDLSGTRISETNTLRGIDGRNLSYSDEDHLLAAGDAVYSYDLDGFLTTKTESGQVTTYEYSTRGELLEVTLAEGRIISYEHDPLGRRIAKRIDGVIVAKYLWEGLTKLLAVYDGSNNLIQRFEYADGRMPVAMTQGGSRYFLAYDQVGSLRVIADASGNTVKRIDYDTFGNVLADTNSSLTPPFGFAGGLHDSDTGLVRFGFRDYDPDTGRWTAKDPIGFAGGDTDLYGYVQNNPVNRIDPLGLVDSVTAAYNSAMASGNYAEAAAIAESMGWGAAMAAANAGASMPKPGSKPKDAPPGTIPIDKSGLSKDDIHTIKDGIGAGPKDWTGISPDGDVISGDSDGNSVNNGPYEDYLPHKCR